MGGLAARCGSGRRSDHPCAAELDYHLTRLTTALSGLNQGGFRFGLYSHREQAELLAEIDCLLEQTEEIHDIAVRAREVLLRPPPEDKEPGFVE